MNPIIEPAWEAHLGWPKFDKLIERKRFFPIEMGREMRLAVMAWEHVTDR